ncbi:DUF433 domain-containing protein [Mesorhizobium sp.]|uniref:DUF433 domain-containing protein n=1 Tax=Mesorhizobium sp. TaxID=1871066 RepID=UPI00121A91DB|nr:DUF433 domain-containing protein [Mesorhizobium sp.]TIO10618.1 MAG: DUF433 domain-containing protein [Mesorhizobium sp.]TIO35438.1 MAG: DUF433 domain-containing protein [Mesorhizobium sp.]TIP13493.1 MAG: DUF433 domain-containing protein [Mesorhizobium sp.]
MATTDILRGADLFGVGSYTIQEAARLVRTPAINVSRWMRGYSYRRKGQLYASPPLWRTQWPTGDNDPVEIGFRDLIELRFVKVFTEAGVGLLAIRNCLDFARHLVADDHPFSTRRFRTDGKSIFLESAKLASDEKEMLDLKRRQYVFGQIIERTFKDLDIEDDAVARWRPFNGKDSIVIDPNRSFGQPIAADSGVPTIVLAQAVEAEGSHERVARLFEVSLADVKDAVRFESTLGTV